jgi:small-conductance mechanosensitive channel
LLLIGAILGVSGEIIALVLILMITFGMILFVFLIKDQLPNAFAGIYLTATDSINIGDTIALDDKVKGVIKSISLLHTTLDGKKGALFVIPNRSLTSTIISVTKRCDDKKASCKEA